MSQPLREVGPRGQETGAQSEGFETWRGYRWPPGSCPRGQTSPAHCPRAFENAEKGLSLFYNPYIDANRYLRFCVLVTWMNQLLKATSGSAPLFMERSQSRAVMRARCNSSSVNRCDQPI